MVVVTVIGLGFVGLTTALGFAELGNKVYGYDINKSRMKALKNGHIEILEPFLEEKLKEHSNKRFYLSENMSEMMTMSDCIFICVGSPCNEDGSVDLSQVKTAIQSCLENIPSDGKYRTLVIKSTVPPGTCSRELMPLVMEKIPARDMLGLASNPEFLREGKCWEDFMSPSRVVLGSSDSKAIELLKELYKPLKVPMHCLSTNGAEFSKYLSNVMLATMISFSNELAYAAKCFGDIDIVKTFEALHDDFRLRNAGIASYIYPGCGYGGYCLPKDIQAFTTALGTVGYNSVMLQSVININNSVIERLCDEICEAAADDEVIGVLGLAFKPETDDVRDTASYHIIKSLIERGYSTVGVYDPAAMATFKSRYPELRVIYYNSAETLVDNSDVLVVATAWKEFAELDYKGKKIIDGRYIIKEKSGYGK